MKFLELVLHNFAVFRGRQVVDLSPADPNAPIILFGGLNGAGKTTILDAIQLALYGIRANCSKRGGLSYEDFLLRSVNRSVPPADGAAVELELLVHSAEGDQKLRVQRSWYATAAGVRERLEVLRDGVLDQSLTEDWPERVEEMLPLGISKLFFFDGDRIEDLADLENSQEIVHTALQNLLGLNLVDQLETDLQVFEQRKARERPSENSELERLNELDGLVESARTALSQLKDRKAKLERGVDEAKADVEDIEASFIRSGGGLLEQRKQLEVEVHRREHIREANEDHLRSLAAGAAPLLLVLDLLEGVCAEDQLDQERERARLLKEVLEERDRRLVQEFSNRADREILDEIAESLRDDRDTRTARSDEAPVFSLNAEARRSLREILDEDGENLRNDLRESIEALDQSARALEEAERRSAAVPDEDAIAGLVHERASHRGRLMALTEDLNEVEARLEERRRECESLESERQQIALKLVASDEGREATRRMVDASVQARRHLEEFRRRVLERNVGRIRSVVMDSFNQLLRKTGLVASLDIDPESLELQLFARDGTRLHPNQLSAGERQVLAVSLLWGMAKASGLGLPTVVDTPLGRLDSVHRQHLVQRYFPTASHQVLLLSTDEEITEAHVETLGDRIAQWYHLNYDEETETTSVSPGYFFETVEACA